MSTNWRFRDHRGFQHDAVVVIGAVGAVGALAWALPLSGATWWMMMAVGPLLALLVGQADRQISRRRLITVVTSALGAVLAGATWRALAGGIETMAAGEALLVGLLAGLAALRRRWRSPTSSAWRARPLAARARRRARDAGRVRRRGAGAGGAGGDRPRPDRRRAGRRRSAPTGGGWRSWPRT